MKQKVPPHVTKYSRTAPYCHLVVAAQEAVTTCPAKMQSWARTSKLWRKFYRPYCDFVPFNQCFHTSLIWTLLIRHCIVFCHNHFPLNLIKCCNIFFFLKKFLMNIFFAHNFVKYFGDFRTFGVEIICFVTCHVWPQRSYLFYPNFGHGSMILYLLTK